MRMPRLMGHRGAAAYAPENTLASLRKAKEFGLDWVEFDVQLTGDGQPVLMHDDTLHRTAGDRRKIAQVPLAEVVALDAGGWFDPAFAGEPVPRFEAALALLETLQLRANIEIKPSPGLARETAIVAVETAKARWPESLPLPLISSFEVESLEEAQRLWPEAPRGYLSKKLPPDWCEIATRLECFSVHLWHPGITAEKLAAVKQAGFQTAAYTVNSTERAETLFAMGLDCAITDDPPALSDWAEASAAA